MHYRDGARQVFKQRGQFLQILCLLAGILMLLSLWPLPHPGLSLAIKLVATLAAFWCLVSAWSNRQYIAVIIFLAMVVYVNPIHAWQVSRFQHIMLSLAIALLLFLFADRETGRRAGPFSGPAAPQGRAELDQEYRRLEEMRQRVELEFSLARAERRRAEFLLKQAQRRFRREHGHRAPGDDQGGLEGDPYQTLGVLESDSLEEIRDIYHRLAQIYHPDLYSGSSARTRAARARRMAAINDAYQWIKKSRQGGGGGQD